MMKTFRIAALGAALGAALLLGAALTTASAQAPVAGRNRAVAGAHARGQRQGPRDRALMKGIQLSDNQRTQLKAIHERFAGERKSLVQPVRGGQSATAQRTRPDSAQRTQIRALMERQMAEVRGVLTPDQRRTFDQNAATARDRFAERRGQGGKRGQS